MVNRRHVLAATGAGGLAALSGCIGFVTGSEPAEFSSSPARVPASVLEDTGYSDAGNEPVDIREEFEALGISREVHVRNYRAEYEKSVDLGPLGEEEAAVFTALTTPQASVLGREFNPIADMSARELADLVQDHYDGFGDLEYVEDEEVTINDEETTATTFETQATLTGVDESVELLVIITESVALGDDLAVTVGAYPEMADERDHVIAMMQSVETTE